MAIQNTPIDRFDPLNFTGPARMMSGVAKTGNVTLGQYYGANNSIEYARWLYIGVAGDVNYTKYDGTTQTLVGLAPGVWHPIFSISVNATGTTANSIVWGS